MERLGISKITHCHICASALIPHPHLYKMSKALCCAKHGYFFMQDSDVIFNPFTPKKIKKPEKVKRPYTPPLCGRNDSIRCDQTGEIYNTLKEVTALLGVCRHAMSRHIHGKTRHVRGYTFTVLRDGETHPPFVPKPRFRPGGGIPAARIRCDQTQQVFESIAEASATMGIDRKFLSRHINYPRTRPFVKGYSFTVLSRGV